MTDEIQALKSLYAWPTDKPAVPPKLHGWFSTADIFDQLIPKKRNLVIVEIGSWLGMSAEWFLNNRPSATVICIDTWEGSQQHKDDPKLATMLPTLYETFLVNMWEWKDRLIPMRGDSVDSLYKLSELGIIPDVIYIDGAHDEVSVFKDTYSAIDCFPYSLIFGDDWVFPSVKEGVSRATSYFNISGKIRHKRRVWWLSN